MVPDYTRAGIIKHRFFKPLFEDIYGMEIKCFSYRPIDTIDLNFYGCSISFLQPQGPQMEALKKRCLIKPARVQSGTTVYY